MIACKETGIAVEPIRWTPTGRVQVRVRLAADGRTVGAFCPVDAFQLQATEGEDLGATLARLPS